jgi:hypothetical protein
MDKAQRLDLAAQARLASLRAGRVRERTASLERQYALVSKAIEAYVERYGKEADPSDDFDAFLELIIQHGGVNLGREEVLTGMEMYVARAAASSDAAAALRALHGAMGAYRGTVLKWVGCTRKQFDAALESRLAP